LVDIDVGVGVCGIVGVGVDVTADLTVKVFKVSLGFFLMNNHISKNIFPTYCLYIPFC